MSYEIKEGFYSLFYTNSESPDHLQHFSTWAEYQNLKEPIKIPEKKKLIYKVLFIHAKGKSYG